jgi:hypothetical protein
VVRAGVTVEADVGTIGTTAEYGAEIENPHLADRAACEAMGETGIDALAVAISNAHGVSIAEPKLDFDLLAEIRRRAEVPRVLHGGSGIPVDQVQKAIGMGVAKMNVGTATHVAFKRYGGRPRSESWFPRHHEDPQWLPGPCARRPTPARRHHYVRQTRCVTVVNLTPASLIGGVRRRTIPHRTSRELS